MSGRDASAGIPHGYAWQQGIAGAPRCLRRDWEGAEALAWQCADTGNHNILSTLASLREKAGHLEGAERLYRTAADTGNARYSLARLDRWPFGLDPDGTPTPPWQ
ncbi:hypothetical protein [Streptomyces sp. NPDC058572]|uniref:hypothetical protein n=1 Tax=Streptomyces sp. NPDC058572 TaxID=3346546 RepID=UPI00365CAD88